MTAARSDLLAMAAGLGKARLRLRGALQRWRLPLTIAAAALFAGGAWLSFRGLGLGLSDLNLRPALVQFALAPLSVLYAGIGMVLLARSADVTMGLGKATSLASWATVAEVLPLPGGAMVRAAALMAAGTALGRSSVLVLVNAVLWISLAALGCGAVLLGHGLHAAGALALAGAAGSAITITWLMRCAGPAVAMQTVAHRLAGMTLIAVRLHFAFAVLGVAVPLADTLPFALSNIAGSAASIAPAGLGIGEALAAAAAGTVNVAPGAAFLAVGLDRLVCLAASGLYALFAPRRSGVAA